MKKYAAAGSLNDQKAAKPRDKDTKRPRDQETKRPRVQEMGLASFTRHTGLAPLASRAQKNKRKRGKAKECMGKLGRVRKRQGNHSKESARQHAEKRSKRKKGITRERMEKQGKPKESQRRRGIASLVGCSCSRYTAAAKQQQQQQQQQQHHHHHHHHQPAAAAPGTRNTKKT